METFCIIHINDHETSPVCHVKDKTAAIREVWDKCVDVFPVFYNPGHHVIVEECFVPFRCRCPFQQYMPNKPAKYGIKIWIACYFKSSYAWNMQGYTGTPHHRVPKK